MHKEVCSRATLVGEMILNPKKKIQIVILFFTFYETALVGFMGLASS